jgi:hypothetical protein
MITKICHKGHHYAEAESTAEGKRRPCPKCHWEPIDTYIDEHPEQFVFLGDAHCTGAEWGRIRREALRKRALRRQAKRWAAYVEARGKDFRPLFSCGHPREATNAYIHKSDSGDKITCRICTNVRAAVRYREKGF